MAEGRTLFGANRVKKIRGAALDQEEVARVAYGLYEQRGCEHGHDIEDWAQAERIVRQQQATMS